jgi:endonuclease/exonuclease/phosphatase family metal-dependent hydrolase
VYRPSTGVWHIVQSSTGSGFSISWGAPEDWPVPGDYDGDGAADLAVWRPSNGVWYVLTSSSGYQSSFAVAWGSSALHDVPVPGDFDGDRRTDLAVWRPDAGTWYVKTSSSGYAAHFAVQWGLGALGDIPVVGDFDGDTRADLVVWRPSNGAWYVKQSSTSYRTSYSVRWGAPGDVPVVGDYDGDGKADPTVFRPSTGTWYQLRTRERTAFTVAWGAEGDLPLPNARGPAAGTSGTSRRAATNTHSSPPPPAGSQSGRLRVMTWNIHFGKSARNVLNLDAQAQVMATSNADVILLQEVSTWDGDQPKSLPAKLQALTGRRWSTVWASHDGTGRGEGTLILTRLPVVGSSAANYYNRGFSRVAVAVNGVTIDIFNGHLEYYDTTKRTNQLRAWMAWMEGFGAPRIAGGDFNSWWGQSWIRTMETSYTDTWKDATGSNQNGYTHNNVRFDYLFRARLSANRLTPTSAWVVSTSTSDHRPLVADYAVR